MSAFAFASPNRVLDNIKRLELQEAELPSLPSIQPNLDYDSGMETSRSSIDPVDYRFGDVTDDDMATPHPIKRAFTPATTSTAILKSSSTPTPGGVSPDSTSTSPFPPLRPSTSTSPSDSSSPYIPNRAATSTPHSLYSRASRRFVSDDTRSTTTARQSHLGHSRNRSDTGEFGSGNTIGRENWHTPGEMSGSFSGEEIGMPGSGNGSEVEMPSLPGMEVGELGSEKSVPLHDVSYASSGPGETPITQRFSKSHVVLQRPGRRSHLAQSYIAESEPSSTTPDRATSPGSSTSNVPAPGLRAPESDRVPSLSRSEISATDVSEAASTPEGPTRRVQVVSTSNNDYLAIAQEYSAEHEQYEQEVTDLPETPAYEFQAEAESSTSSSVHSYNDTPAPIQHASPYKAPSASRIGPTGTPFSQDSTPGIARDPAVGVGRNSFDHENYHVQTPGTVLRDVTDQYQASNPPFTPSPAGMLSMKSDLSTPRAPLDDAERRKSHVLAVLSSSGLPQRERKIVRGTPHPLRRFSSSPHSESILGKGTPVQSSHRQTGTPASLSRLTLDRSASAPPNESFVSVASSADLTTDRRGTTALPRFSRANTSFPTMLLPTSKANTSGTPDGGSLRGLGVGGGDHRADGIKIHKHLNAMNKQLLETNSDLAREAEAWRDEVGRLMRLLEAAGLEVEEVDVLGGIAKSRDVSLADMSGGDERSGSVGDVSRGSAGRGPGEISQENENALVIQELAEKLEGLEEILNEKDAQIVELEDEVNALKSNQPRHLQSHYNSINVDQRVQELEDQLEEAEQARQALHTDFANKTEQHARRFGEICTGFEEQVAGLEAELGQAKKEVERLREERETMGREEVGGGREKELGRQVQTLQVELERVKGELREMEIQREGEDKGEVMRRMEKAEAEVVKLEEELKEAQAASSGVASGLETMKAELETLRGEQAEQNGAYTEEIDQLNEEVDNLNALVQAREEELEALQVKLEVAELAAQPLRQSIRQKSTSVSPNKGQSQGQSEMSEVIGNGISVEDQSSFVAALEDRLDEAYREIGRLKHELSSSPHRKNTIEAKDAKIRALEAEKAALVARVSPARGAELENTPTQRASFGLQNAGTPFGKPIPTPTPFVHKSIAALRMPKTPGSLQELSWLNTTIGDSNESKYRAQVEHLQDELSHVNQQLDDNFSRLEAAGMGGIELAEKLAAAYHRISDLEDEIRALLQRNKASLALVHAEREETSRASDERLQIALSAVHAQLDDLKLESSRERKRLLSANEGLIAAKATAEEQLDEEMVEMRKQVNEAIDAANDEVEQAKKDAVAASSEAAGLRKDLQAARAESERLDKRLSALQQQLEEEGKRHAREMIDRGVSHRDLSDKIAEIDRLRSAQRESDGRVQSLSSQLVEKGTALDLAKERISDLMAERNTIMSDLEDFERDLNTQRTAARRLTEELQALQDQQTLQEEGEKEKAEGLGRKYREVVGELQRATSDLERSRGVQEELNKVEKEYRAVRQEMRGLEKEIQRVREEKEGLERWRNQHVCVNGSAQALVDQKSRFKAQTRDLATQIQYLKAKYTREATFRNGLALQKRYLLLLVGGMSLNEQATLKALATLGYPQPDPPRRTISLKAVVLAVIGLNRARKSAVAWRNEKELKAGALANVGERRRVSGRT